MSIAYSVDPAIRRKRVNSGPSNPQTLSSATSDKIVIYDAEGRTRFANLFETLPAVSATMTTEYCFRQSGSVAFIFSTVYGDGSKFPALVTSNPVRIEFRYYFDDAGQNIRELQRAFDAKDNTPLRANAMRAKDLRPRFYASADLLDRSFRVH